MQVNFFKWLLSKREYTVNNFPPCKDGYEEKDKIDILTGKQQGKNVAI